MLDIHFVLIPDFNTSFLLLSAANQNCRLNELLLADWLNPVDKRAAQHTYAVSRGGSSIDTGNIRRFSNSSDYEPGVAGVALSSNLTHAVSLEELLTADAEVYSEAVDYDCDLSCSGVRSIKASCHVSDMGEEPVVSVTDVTVVCDVLSSKMAKGSSSSGLDSIKVAFTESAKKSTDDAPTGNVIAKDPLTPSDVSQSVTNDLVLLTKGSGKSAAMLKSVCNVKDGSMPPKVPERPLETLSCDLEEEDSEEERYELVTPRASIDEGSTGILSPKNSEEIEVFTAALDSPRSANSSKTPLHPFLTSGVRNSEKHESVALDYEDILPIARKTVECRSVSSSKTSVDGLKSDQHSVTNTSASNQSEALPSRSSTGGKQMLDKYPKGRNTTEKFKIETKSQNSDSGQMGAQDKPFKPIANSRPKPFSPAYQLTTRSTNQSENYSTFPRSSNFSERKTPAAPLLNHLSVIGKPSVVAKVSPLKDMSASWSAEPISSKDSGSQVQCIVSKSIS